MNTYDKKLEELAEKYVREEFQLDEDQEYFTEAHFQAHGAFKKGFLKRNEMCVYLVDLHNPYPDLSFEKYKKGFEILEECMEQMHDLNFSRYDDQE